MKIGHFALQRRVKSEPSPDQFVHRRRASNNFRGRTRSTIWSMIGIHDWSSNGLSKRMSKISWKQTYVYYSTWFICINIDELASINPDHLPRRKEDCSKKADNKQDTLYGSIASENQWRIGIKREGVPVVEWLVIIPGEFIASGLDPFIKSHLSFCAEIHQ